MYFCTCCSFPLKSPEWVPDDPPRPLLNYYFFCETSLYFSRQIYPRICLFRFQLGQNSVVVFPMLLQDFWLFFCITSCVFPIFSILLNWNKMKDLSPGQNEMFYFKDLLTTLTFITSNFSTSA